MKVKVCELSHETFDLYGKYMLPTEVDCNNEDKIAFYPDQLVGLSETSNMIGISILALEKRIFIIDVTEKHEQTEEIFGGFSKDVLFHVAISSGKVPEKNDFKIFRLPAGGFVRIKRKVWHHAPLPIEDGRIQGIVVLPPYTYTHDCLIVNIEEKIEIGF